MVWMVWFLAFLIHVLLALFTGTIAKGKNRDFALWFAFGFFLPVWGLFFAVLINDEGHQRAFPDPRKRK